MKLTSRQCVVLLNCIDVPQYVPSAFVPNGVTRSLVMRGLLRETGRGFQTTEEGLLALCRIHRKSFRDLAPRVKEDE